MKREILLIVLAISMQSIFSQEQIEFGKVTKEELTEVEYEKDKSANAIILYKKRYTYFSFFSSSVVLTTKIHKRIKIYDKEGFDFATEVINLYKTENDDEDVKNIKAITYNLENDKIVETELDKEQIFETEARYNYNQVKFTMPNVQEGSVLDISYEIKSPFIWNIDEFRFQYAIPVKKLEAKIKIPKMLKFKQTHKGFIPFYPKIYPVRSQTKDMMNEYVLNDIPALKEEDYTDNINNYRAGVLFELLSVELTNQIKTYSKTWKNVAETIGNTYDYKKGMDKTNFFDDQLDALLADKMNKVEKMKAILKYVKDNVTWNGMDGKYCYNGLKKTMVEKKGNVADINLLLVTMLRYAKIESNPLILSTKDNLIPLFPTVDRLNHVIAYAIIDEKQYFLDATEEFSDINVLPIKDYNWKGILINNRDMVWEQIDIVSPEKSNKMFSVNMALKEDGSVEGKYNSRFDKHSAFGFRKEFKSQDLETYLNSKENRFSGIEINDYVVKNEKVYEGPVSESFSFYHDYGGDVIDEKLYIKPMSFLRMEENPFKLENREFPIDFGYPFKDIYMINITIPDGYTIESKPESSVVKLPDNLGVFRYSLSVKDKTVNVIANFEINQSFIPATSYPFLKEFFKQVISKESEQLVLSKI